APGVSWNDRASHGGEAPQHASGARDVALEHGLANPRRGDHAELAVLDAGHHFDRETELGSHAPQEPRVAAAAVPEPEVGTDAHVPDAKARDEHLRDEVFGALPRELLVERDHDARLDPGRSE